MGISFLSWQLCIYSPLHLIAMPSFCIEEYQYSKISSQKQDDVDCLEKTIIIIIMKWSLNDFIFINDIKIFLPCKKVSQISHQGQLSKEFDPKWKHHEDKFCCIPTKTWTTLSSNWWLVLCLAGDWLIRNDWPFLIGSLVVRLRQLAEPLRAHLNNLQTILINNHIRYENITQKLSHRSIVWFDVCTFSSSIIAPSNEIVLNDIVLNEWNAVTKTRVKINKTCTLQK